jgi:hypothetical protein
MCASFRVDELCVHAHAIGAALGAAFQHVAHPELAANLPGIHGLVFVGESRFARDDETIRKARYVRGQVFRDRIDEVVVLLVATEIGEGQHHDRQSWPTRRAQDFAATRKRRMVIG